MIDQQVKDYKSKAAELENLWTETRGKPRAGARDVGEILEKTSTRIDHIKNMATENEEMGNRARTQLEHDREKLGNSLNTMGELSDDVTIANSYVGRMSRYGVSVALLIVILDEH